MVNALNIRIFIITCFFFLSLCLKAQDIHFSQVHTVPQLLNPANTGVMEPRMRFTNNYRSQWHQLGYPFISNYLSFESKVGVLNRPLGIGAFLLHDQSSNVYLRADKLYFSVNHSSYFRNHQIAFGVQPGMVIKSLDKSSTTFGSQFDPGSEIYDPNLPSGEGQLKEGLRYFDLNIGVLWRAKIKNKFHSAGFSISHINKPLESFYKGGANPRLAMKYTLHGGLNVPMGDRYSINPLYMYSISNGTGEFIGGATGSYYPMNNNMPVDRLYALLQFRANPPENIDAVIFGAGLRFLSFDFFISYDITVSALRKASNTQGAFEISIIYNLTRQKIATDNEPCFML
jgi:type IX secretion system PorP/SprF family membrane protein